MPIAGYLVVYMLIVDIIIDNSLKACYYLYNMPIAGRSLLFYEDRWFSMRKPKERKMKRNGMYIAVMTMLLTLSFTACDNLLGGTQQITPLDTPAPQIEQDTFTLKWAAVSGATSYTVDIGDGSTPKVVTGTEYSLEGLTSKHQVYSIKVNAIGSNSISAFSAAISCHPAEYIFEFEEEEVPARALIKIISVKALKKYGKTLKNIVIPKDMTYSGAAIPVTAIKSGAFIDAPAMESVVIPDSIVSIGNKAFEGCEKLGTVVIPASITELGAEAFKDCTSLTTVTFKADAAQAGTMTIDQTVFDGCGALTTVDVPEGSKTAYETILENKIPETAQVVIAVPVIGVTLSPQTLSLAAGASGNLVPSVLPENATNKNVKWSSSNSAVAAVGKGTVTAIAAGTATITVTTADGEKSATCTVTVTAGASTNPTVAVSGVTLSPQTLNLTLGADGSSTGTLTATVTPSNATNKNVTWTSSAPETASVSNGVVTAKAAGNAIITVTTEDGKKEAWCTVKVSANTGNTVPVTGVTLSPENLSLTVGGTYSLRATVLPASAANQNVIWTCNPAGVVTVNEEGTVTGKLAGTAVITVTTVDGRKTATCTVIVSGSGSGDGQNLIITVRPEPVSEKYFIVYDEAGKSFTIADGYKLHEWYRNDILQTGNLNSNALSAGDKVQVIVTDSAGVPYSNFVDVKGADDPVITDYYHGEVHSIRDGWGTKTSDFHWKAGETVYLSEINKGAAEQGYTTIATVRVLNWTDNTYFNCQRTSTGDYFFTMPSSDVTVEVTYR